jgi:hypothetical protein
MRIDGFAACDSSNFPLLATETIIKVAMQERRTNPRRKMVLPVKISGTEGAGLAYTMDITSGGARLGGVRATLEAGQTVSLTRNGRKANFKVVWVRQINPSEIQVGIEAQQGMENFWGVDLSDRQQNGKKDMDALMSLINAAKKD